MIYCIVAIDQNQGIGFNNSMPWPKLKEDLQWFKDQTQNNIVIMGSKTWESIGKPLPNRINVVVSSTLKPAANFTFYDPKEAIKDLSERFKDKDIFVIGGESIYNCLKDTVEVFYVTEIDQKYQCDRFFDFQFVKNNFKNESVIKEVDATETTPRYTIKKYTK
jgi:dihydrofolate reductase